MDSIFDAMNVAPQCIRRARAENEELESKILAFVLLKPLYATWFNLAEVILPDLANILVALPVGAFHDKNS